MSNNKLVTVLKTGGKDFNESHVAWMQRQVGTEIICLTDSQIDIPNVIKIPLVHNFRGWWSKMEIFRPDLIDLGNFLYADLDTVFLNGIPEDYLKLDETVVLSPMLKNQVWKDVINSGFMFIANDHKQAVWDAWIDRPVVHMQNLRGDQDFLDHFLRPCTRWQDLFPNEIVSYKGDIVPQKGFKGTEKVVCFHGIPRPWLSGQKWVPPL